MKASDGFKVAIQAHLDILAMKDALFAQTLKKPNKNIDDCVTYILNEVHKSGQQGFADEEIYKMAVHYYDEDDIKIGKKLNAKVVVNHHKPAPTPTTAPKPTEAKQEVKKPVAPVTASKPQPSKPVVKKQDLSANQISLF